MENDIPMQQLITLHTIFIMLFATFIVISAIIGTRFVREVSAYHQCSHVEDSDFTACYEPKK